ncbi:hypothetical protein [Psychromonas sp. SA13A]|uniref:hypothetical protein n=1 Tax=Psychromonas sp. SA13A TaxID=2686346 RepID=UPI00140DD24D|nr:hypothetical protein [Psychromonas sp. SA13A]
MKFINIIKGDFEQTKWMLEEDKLILGSYNVQEIPIREIISIEKKEVIKKDYYVVFKLGSGQNFTAMMKEKNYNHLYKAFLSKGNNPTNINLPIKNKPKANKVWFCTGLAILAIFLFISRGASESDLGSIARLDACDYLAKNNLPTGDWKEHYGEYSCNSEYYDVDVSNNNSLSNNIAYYVQGTSPTIWDTLKIVGNVNTPKDRDEFNHQFNKTIKSFIDSFSGKPVNIFAKKDVIMMIDQGKIESPIKLGKVEYDENNSASIFLSGKKILWKNSSEGFEYQFIIERRK